MIMTPSDSGFPSMPSSSALIPESTQPRADGNEAGDGQLLQQRLALVEDLWRTVLQSECPPEQAERLLRMKQLSDPVLPGEHPAGTDALIDLIKEMDLAEAIAAARAFSLYFQLVNILEQRIEEDTYLESINRSQDQADLFDPFAPPLATQTEPATFRELFERLRRLNVPPARAGLTLTPAQPVSVLAAARVALLQRLVDVPSRRRRLTHLKVFVDAG